MSRLETLSQWICKECVCSLTTTREATAYQQAENLDFVCEKPGCGGLLPWGCSSRKDIK